MSRPLALEQIQSHILLGYQYGQQPAHARHLFFGFQRDAAPQAWLSAVQVHVTTAERASNPAVALGLSYAGFARLGADPFSAEQFQAFRAGMPGRAELLDDSGESAPEHWRFGGAAELHAVVSIEGSDPAALATLEAAIRAVAGASCLFAVSGARRADGREPFGFVDGISQPDLAGGPIAQPPGHGVLTAEGAWRPVQPGEFILGYDDEEGPTDPPAALRDGTFYVFRLLEQDVVGFHRFLADEAQRTGLPLEVLKAKLLGRWPDGRPLVGDERPAFDFARDNDFRYAQDADGYGCPHGAHIRRANPRDMLEKEADRAERHRLIRRALPYDDGGEVGLCFGVLNASIERQFEFVQQRWINAGSTAKRLGHSRDPLFGSPKGEGCHVVPGEAPRLVGGLRRFVRTRGGGYFFLPSRRLLDELATRRVPVLVAPKPAQPVLVAPKPAQPAPVEVERRHLRWPRFLSWSWGTSPTNRVWTVILPVADRATLEAELEERRTAVDARFADVTQGGHRLIHYARFALFSGLSDEPEANGGDPKGYLLFVCNHDGSPFSFLRGLYDSFSAAPFPFDRAAGYPHRQGFWAFAWYFYRHYYPAAFGFDMYEATVQEVQHGLEVRRQLRALVRATQADEAAFPERYAKFVSEVKRYL